MTMLSRRELLAAFASSSALRAREVFDSSSVDSPTRGEAALQVRMDAARTQSEQPQSAGVSNGDDFIPRHIAVFTKGLPHDQYGEVDGAAYQTLLDAIASGKHQDFE